MEMLDHRRVGMSEYSLPEHTDHACSISQVWPGQPHRHGLSSGADPEIEEGGGAYI